MISPEFKKSIKELQEKIISLIDEADRHKLSMNSPDIMHITLSVLNLREEEIKKKAVDIFENQKDHAKKFLENSKLKVSLGGLDFFGYEDPKIFKEKQEKAEEKKQEQASSKKKNRGVIFLDVLEDEHTHKLRKFANLWIKEYVDHGIIAQEHLEKMSLCHNKDHNIYHAKKYHVTLFYFEKGLDLSKIIEAFKDLKFGEIHGQTLELNVMGKFDETNFYQSIQKHHL